MKKIFCLILLLVCCFAVTANQNGIKPLLGKQVAWSHPLADGLAALWLMNEGGGDIIQDLSGNGNNGVVTGATWIGGDIDCAANTDNVDFGSSYLGLDVTQAFTVILNDVLVKNWIVSDYIFGRSAYARPVNFTLANTNSVLMVVQTDGDNASVKSANGTLPQDVKTNVVGTWDGTTARIYINGVESNTNTPASPGDLVFIDAARNWRFGEGHQVPGSGFIGSGGSISIYNCALSASEIAQLYQDPFAMFRDVYSWMYFTAPIAGGQVIFVNMN